MSGMLVWLMHEARKTCVILFQQNDPGREACVADTEGEGGTVGDTGAGGCLQCLFSKGMLCVVITREGEAFAMFAVCLMFFMCFHCFLCFFHSSFQRL